MPPITYQPAGIDKFDARLKAADKPGEHLWVMTAAWLIADPASAYDPDIVKLLDSENLIAFAGPGCFKCEKPYSRNMTKRRCLGKIEL